MEHLNRRRLLASGIGAAGAGLLGAPAPASAIGANDRIVVGIMGTGGRGTALSRACQQQPNVDVAYTCDVDMTRAEKAAAVVAPLRGGVAPKAVQDYRKVLEDKAVDVLVVATCNHWHAPGAILGCAAGKHVYVEKPCSHNAQEGEWLVQAARKHDRRVQMGNQRRSWPKIQEAMQRLHEGVIGRIYYAQSWYANSRGSIGQGKSVAAPANLNYDLWQGPAPRRSFKDNYLHYNWHWFWHWGNGELGNNGIHYLDMCRWGLKVDFPTQLVSSGGRYRFQDDQETPDTHMATYNFEGGKFIQWEGMSCNQPPKPDLPDAVFHGENGSLAIRGGGYTLHDPKGKEIEKVTGPIGEAGHIANFLASIRSGDKLNSEIEQGHRSTLLCHLGNISYRTGRVLKTDPSNGHILGDRDAAGHWRREYEKGYEPKV